jgi:hypothetical protein
MLSALRRLPAVSEVVSQDEANNQPLWHTFVVISHDRTIAREVARTVVQGGWELHELRPITLGLEELFVRLTGEEQKAAA